MFASNTAEILNLEVKKVPADVFTKILYVHKKLKEIARYESSYKEKHHIAKLNPEQLEEIKTLESKVNCTLVAYGACNETKEKKLKILNKIHSLLDEYVDVCKSKKINNSESDFTEFFEQ